MKPVLVASLLVSLSRCSSGGCERRHQGDDAQSVSGWRSRIIDRARRAVISTPLWSRSWSRSPLPTSRRASSGRPGKSRAESRIWWAFRRSWISDCADLDSWRTEKAARIRQSPMLSSITWTRLSHALAAQGADYVDVAVDQQPGLKLDPDSAISPRGCRFSSMEFRPFWSRSIGTSSWREPMCPRRQWTSAAPIIRGRLQLPGCPGRRGTNTPRPDPGELRVGIRRRRRHGGFQELPLRQHPSRDQRANSQAFQCEQAAELIGLWPMLRPGSH